VTAPRASADSCERRVVMFVRNPCTTDVRVLREAETLRRAGWATTIMALQTGGAKAPPDREVRDGVVIVRVPYPSDWRKRWHAMRSYPWRWVRGVPSNAMTALRSGARGARRAVALVAAGVVALPYAALQRVRYMAGHRPKPRTIALDDGWDHLAWWRYSVLGWARAAAAAAPAADVYHGHDLTALPAAVAAARRKEGSIVIYDSHELFVEAGAEARQPWWVRQVLWTYERRLVRSVTAILTVNDGIADELHRRYPGPSITVIHNTPPRQPIAQPKDDRIRGTLAIPHDAPVVLYHGGFQRERGLEILIEAFADERLQHAHLVLLGFGALEERLRGLAADPRFGGRVHVVPAVPPEELLAWVASADVGAMPIQPSTVNHRLSTPNKLFESIAVGTPVVASDMPGMAAVVRETGCGVLVDPTRVEAVAAGIADLLALSAPAKADLRARCLRAAHEQYNWETESARLIGLYDRLEGAHAAS
jgi:glycosyltransferase involved in cell wall biosynthesis